MMDAAVPERQQERYAEATIRVGSMSGVKCLEGFSLALHLTRVLRRDGLDRVE
jgi:hypothetical protein